MNRTAGSVLEDVAYLARSEHRVTTLAALTVRPRSRSELWELTGVSSSTMRRTLREFEERHWVFKDGHEYETTQLGAYIAASMVELIEQFETERNLRKVWEWLPAEESGFAISMCTDAEVTIADAENPYRPVTRFKSLLDQTSEVRFAGFDIALLEPLKDDFVERIIDGMQTEIINPPRVIRYIRSTNPDLFSTALESGNLTVRVHDDLPSYGVCIFDDRVAISGYDREGVTVRVLVDTVRDDTREWAESIYQIFSRQTPTFAI